MLQLPGNHLPSEIQQTLYKQSDRNICKTDATNVRNKIESRTKILLFL